MDIADYSNQIEEISKSYTHKFNIDRTDNWFMLKLQEELGELTQAYLMMTHQARSKDKSTEELRNSFEQELADAFCHLLLLAKHHNVNIEEQIDNKWLIWKNKQ